MFFFLQNAYVDRRKANLFIHCNILRYCIIKKKRISKFFLNGTPGTLKWNTIYSFKWSINNFLHAKSVLCLSFYIHVVVQFLNTFNKVSDMQLSNKEDLFIFLLVFFFFLSYKWICSKQSFGRIFLNTQSN